MRTIANTVQPCPRTSSRERPNDSRAPRFSTTITGAITAQIVSRNRPGTISRMSPSAMPRPARSPATSSGTIDGETRENTSPSDASKVPSRASCTA